MEKGTPHCKLPVVKRLVDEGKVRMTRTALIGAADMGFDALAIIEVVKALSPKDFYKSMTVHEDHRVWQDVYRPHTSAGEAYLKLTVIEDVLIVSFKEL
ncbi:MAG: type II toxin-antitoxin system MqsR family toxin [Zoogloea sp.]|nr:type II toxin-antitoxin system MqsR family toxin [Zoogloea sp.]